MKRIRLVLGVLAIALGLGIFAGTDADPGNRAVILTIDDAIGPATADYYIRGLAEAAERGAPVIVLQLNTPGGLDTAMRDIIRATLASPVPVITWVAPSGARAASAGTYMLYASHVAAMAPATNLGAATPVAIGGGTPSPDREDDNGEDEPEPRTQPQDAGSLKAVNDAVAYIRGLAELRGRNAEWAEKAVREAASLTASDALSDNVIDLIAEDMDALLLAADGRQVKTAGGAVVLQTAGLQVEHIEPDWRNRLLATITNPSVAYLLLIIGLYGLLLEGYSPGAIVPGVVGVICLLVAAYALQLLPINYVGLALLLVGVVLIVAETLVPSFGALGFGGIVALVIGSIMLLDTDVPGYGVSTSLIGAVALFAGGILLATLTLVLKARRQPVVTGEEQILTEIAVAVGSFEREGKVRMHGEIWNATSDRPVSAGQKLRVLNVEGLHLNVTPEEQS